MTTPEEQTRAVLDSVPSCWRSLVTTRSPLPPFSQGRHRPAMPLPDRDGHISLVLSCAFDRVRAERELR
jgi:hypothetical protein